MFTPRRSSRVSVIASAPCALDRVDGRRRAQRCNDVGQVTQVLNFDIDEDFEEIERPVGNLEVGDIPTALADDRRQAAKTARLVVERYVNAPDMGAGRCIGVPSDVKPTFWRIGESRERLAIDRVDRNAFPRRDDPNDAIAGQRMTATRVVQRHSRDKSADRNRVICLLAPRWNKWNHLGGTRIGLWRM